MEDAFWKPGDGEREAPLVVRTLWRREGLVEEVYWPGKSSRLAAAPGADTVAPTANPRYIIFE